MSESNRGFARRTIQWKLKNIANLNLNLNERRNHVQPEPWPEQNIKIEINGVETEWFLSLIFKLGPASLKLQDDPRDEQPCEQRLETWIQCSFFRVQSSPSPLPRVSGNLRACLEKTDGTFYEVFSHKILRKTEFKRELRIDDVNLVTIQDILDPSKMLLNNNNELTIHFELELLEDAKAVCPALDFAAQNLKKIFNSQKYSDFKIICSDRKEIFVHKALISQCDVFEAMFDAKMSEHEKNEVKVDDVDYETMLELVRFIYYGRVNEMRNVNDRLLVAANKYGLQDLKEMCVSSLMENLTQSNIFEVLAIADLVNESHLKANCIDFIKCHYNHLKLNFKEDVLCYNLMKEIMDSMPIHYEVNFRTEAQDSGRSASRCEWSDEERW